MHFDSVCRTRGKLSSINFCIEFFFSAKHIQIEINNAFNPTDSIDKLELRLYSRMEEESSIWELSWGSIVIQPADLRKT